MQLKESHRNYILLGMIAIIIIGLVAAKITAKAQDKEFLKNELLYEQVSQLYQKGNYEESQKYINELLKTQPNSEVVNYMGGLIAATNSEFKQAAILMQKTLDINPYKAEDPVFMLQLGEIMSKAERYEEAKIVLTRCQEAGWAPEDYPNYQEQVAQLLTSIENKE